MRRYRRNLRYRPCSGASGFHLYRSDNRVCADGALLHHRLGRYAEQSGVNTFSGGPGNNRTIGKF